MSIPREQIMASLAEGLANLNFFETEDPNSIALSVANGPQIVGVFGDPIFNSHPDEVIEVLKELIILIQKNFSGPPKEKFLFETLSKFAALSYGSIVGPMSCSGSDSINTHAIALNFLRNKRTIDFITSLKEHIN